MAVAERRLLLARTDRPDSAALAGAVEDGAYETLRKALGMDPSAIVEEVKTSGLRGRGGAGFPTGLKWSFVDRSSGNPVYLVVNADESEPGTFKDRVIIERDPHLMLEGIAIAAWAVGAHRAYVYMRGEFYEGYRILRRAIAEAEEAGYLGDGILGTGFSLEVSVHRGAGAYICGEETGLLESLEGNRAYPRLKPPFPAVKGLFGAPTVVNNVETLANLPMILRDGGEAYRKIGSDERNTGTRLLCVSGHVERPGVYEFEVGALTLRELIFDACGGIPDGRSLKAVIPGGSSAKILRADEIDVRIDFDSLAAAGSMAGSGGVIVLDDTVPMVSALRNVTAFYAHESCGQCTPCREGTLWALKILTRIENCEGRPGDLDMLLSMAANMQAGRTVCPLGDAAAWPIESYITKFRDEFDAAVAHGGDGSSTAAVAHTTAHAP